MRKKLKIFHWLYSESTIANDKKMRPMYASMLTAVTAPAKLFNAASFRFNMPNAMPTIMTTAQTGIRSFVMSAAGFHRGREVMAANSNPVVTAKSLRGFSVIIISLTLCRAFFMMLGVHRSRRG